MITTKIQVKPHLAEYCIGRFSDCDHEKPVHFPASSDLYVTIWDLMQKRPVNVSPVDDGNLEIVLPHRQVGKNPLYYNYISARGAKLIERKIEELLYEELHHVIREDVRQGFTIIDSIALFRSRYGITSISEDAYVKEYYRLRQNTINRRKKKQ